MYLLERKLGGENSKVDSHIPPYMNHLCLVLPNSFIYN